MNLHFELDFESTLLPYPLLILNIISLSLTIITFVLSLFNLTQLAVWVGAGCAVIGIIYHSSIFILAWRRRYRRNAEQALRSAFSTVSQTSTPPPTTKDRTLNDLSTFINASYTSGSLLGLYLLLVTWTVVFIVVIQSILTHPSLDKTSLSQLNGNAARPPVRIISATAVGLEVLVMLFSTIHHTTVSRRLSKEQRYSAEATFFDFSRSNTLRSVARGLTVKKESSFSFALKRKSSFGDNFLIVQPPPRPRLQRDDPSVA